MSDSITPEINQEQHDRFNSLYEFMNSHGQLAALSGFYRGEPRIIVCGVWSETEDGPIGVAPLAILITSDMLDDIADSFGNVPQPFGGSDGN